MKSEDVKALVEAGFEDADVAVEGEGDRFLIRVISDAFEGLMPVKKQQLVYSCINPQIAARLANGAARLQRLEPALAEQLSAALRELRPAASANLAEVLDRIL